MHSTQLTTVQSKTAAGLYVRLEPLLTRALRGLGLSVILRILTGTALLLSLTVKLYCTIYTLQQV